MASRIATIKGVALAPGISKNGRRYTAENIRNAHKRLTARLADPNGRPVTMRTYHPGNATDHQDVTNVVGRVTGATLDTQGALHFEADIAPTVAGRDVAALVMPDQPYLRNVSIRGWWVDDPVIDGQGCEMAHDLEIDGLEFVTNPGVEMAQIHTAVLAESTARHPISESVEDPTVTLIDEASDALTPGSNYADPGYQKDKKKRYPLDTKVHVKAAWGYINKPANQKPYTAAQLRRIKAKIKAAASKFGVKITDESAVLSLPYLTEASTILEELQEAMACVSVSNGPADISVAAYGNDPADLQAIVGRLSDAVLAALDAVDPDADGDIDIPSSNEAAPSGSPTGESTTTEGDAPVSTPNTPEGFAGMTTGVASPHAGTPGVTPAAAPAATPAVEAAPAPAAAPAATPPAAPAAAPVAEGTPAAAPTVPAPAPTPTLSEADQTAIAAKVLAGLQAASVAPAPAVPATEGAPVETPAAPGATGTPQFFTAEQAREMASAAVKEAASNMQKALTDEAIALVRSGGRRGVVRPTNEAGVPKALHEMSEEERNAYANEAWGAVLARRPA